VRSRSRDGDRDVADQERTEPVPHRHSNRPSAFGLRHDASSLGVGHWFVGRVLERADSSTLVVVAHQPEKRHHTTSIRIADLGHERAEIHWRSGEE
jgi:hypothetical protein